MAKASWRLGTAVSPLSRHRNPSTIAVGQLGEVGEHSLLTLGPSRWDSHSRMASGQEQVRTDSMYTVMYSALSSRIETEPRSAAGCPALRVSSSVISRSRPI